MSIAIIDICLGVYIGLQIGIFILQHFFHIVLDWKTHSLGLTFMTSGIILSSIIFYFFMTKLRLKYRNEMIEQEKIKRTAMEKEYLSANLKMLQAQIEPHFLFNTLSNIVSLIDTQPDKGKSMLLDLTKYSTHLFIANDAGKNHAVSGNINDRSIPPYSKNQNG